MESLIKRLKWQNDRTILFNANSGKNLLQLYVNVENQNLNDILKIDSIIIRIGGSMINKLTGEQLIMHNLVMDEKIHLQLPSIKSWELFFHTMEISCKMKSNDLPLPIIEMLYNKAQTPSPNAAKRSVKVLEYQQSSTMSISNDEENIRLFFAHQTFQIAVAFFDDKNQFLPSNIVDSIQLTLNNYEFLKQTSKNHWLYLDKLMNKIPIQPDIPIFTLTFEKPNIDNKKHIFTLNASRFNDLQLKIKWSSFKTGNVRIVVSSCAQNEMRFMSGIVGLAYST